VIAKATSAQNIMTHSSVPEVERVRTLVKGTAEVLWSAVLPTQEMNSMFK
jgi:hypothetical protein